MCVSIKRPDLEVRHSGCIIYQLGGLRSESESCLVVSNSLQSDGLYVVCQAPLFMGFSGQEYWSGLPCLEGCLQGIFPTQGLILSHLSYPGSPGEGDPRLTSPKPGWVWSWFPHGTLCLPVLCPPEGLVQLAHVH